MGWMKTDQSFDNRAAILTISRQHLRSLKGGELFENTLTYENGKDNPHRMEELVINCLLSELRPDLDGCVLCFVNFDWSTQRWEFAVSHGSLSPVKIGECFPRIPLVEVSSDPVNEIAEVTLPTQFAVADSSDENSGDWFRRVMSQPAD